MRAAGHIAGLPAVGLFFAHECRDCGLLNRFAAPVDGTTICCARCGMVLRAVKDHAFGYGLAWTIAALFFYLLAVFSPMLEVGLYGNTRNGAIETGPFALDNQGYWLLAAVVFLTTVCMPFLKIMGTLAVLIPLRRGLSPRWVPGLYAFLKHLKPWVMIEVYLLGLLVAYSRLQVIAAVHPMTAVIGLTGLMLTMVAMDATIDEEIIWGSIKPRQPVDKNVHRYRLLGCDTCNQVTVARPLEKCPRCDEILRHRKPNSMARAWALTIAAAILYVPSNTLPIMTIIKLGRGQSYTIYAGLMELAHVGLWPLAALVFIASIAIPVFKLLSLAALMIGTRRGSAAQLVNRTRLYRLIDFIGRWSMVDIFVVSILVALVRFGWLSQVLPEAGAVYFAAVVILTLLAVQSFDPRLMWDAATRETSTRPLPEPVSGSRFSS